MQLVEVVFAGEEFIVSNIDEAYFNESLDFDEKETHISSLLQNAFNDVIIKKPLSGKHVSFTLPQKLFFIAELPLENTLLDADLMEHLQWEFSLLFPYNDIKDFHFQFHRIDSDVPGRVVVGGLHKKFMKIISDFCSRNELTLKYIDTPHFASDNILKAVNDLSSGKKIISLFISDGSVTLNVYRNEKFVEFHKLFPKNAGEIIPKLIEVMKDSIAEEGDSGSISRLYVAGEDVSEVFIANLRKNIKVEIERLNPFDKIKIDSSLLVSDMQFSKQSSFISAAGIAFRIV
jgi:Tfp pilus assembly PilM family ATPase